MKFLFQIIAAIALLVVVVEASPTYVGVKRMTNADRLKRGLGPAPPVFKRTVPGRRSYLPTRASVAKRGSPSPAAAPPAPTKYVLSPALYSTSSHTIFFAATSDALKLEIRLVSRTGLFKTPSLDREQCFFVPLALTHGEFFRSGVTVNSSIDPLAVSFSTTQGSSGPFDITATVRLLLAASSVCSSHEAFHRMRPSPLLSRSVVSAVLL